MPSTEGRQLRLPVNLSPEVKVYLVLFQWAYLLAEVLILVIRSGCFSWPVCCLLFPLLIGSLPTATLIYWLRRPPPPPKDAVTVQRQAKRRNSRTKRDSESSSTGSESSSTSSEDSDREGMSEVFSDLLSGRAGDDSLFKGLRQMRALAAEPVPSSEDRVSSADASSLAERLSKKLWDKPWMAKHKARLEKFVGDVLEKIFHDYTQRWIEENNRPPPPPTPDDHRAPIVYKAEKSDKSKRKSGSRKRNSVKKPLGMSKVLTRSTGGTPRTRSKSIKKKPTQVKKEVDELFLGLTSGGGVSSKSETDTSTDSSPLRKRIKSYGQAKASRRTRTPSKNRAPSRSRSPRKKPAPSRNRSPTKKPASSGTSSKNRAPSRSRSPSKKPASSRTPSTKRVPSKTRTPRKKRALSRSRSSSKKRAPSKAKASGKRKTPSGKKRAPSATGTSDKKPAPSRTRTPSKVQAPSAAKRSPKKRAPSGRRTPGKNREPVTASTDLTGLPNEVKPGPSSGLNIDVEVSVKETTDQESSS